MADTHLQGISGRIAAFASGLRLDDVPEPVRGAAAEHLLDTLGCGLAATGIGAAPHLSALTAGAFGSGSCSVMGSPRTVPPGTAALANGALCHALDFDDTHGGSVCHISAVVAPAALAVAEATGAPGDRVLAAIVTGSEVVARLGMAGAPSYMTTGFHPTGVCGAFGATVAAAMLLGLDAAAIQRAIGICAGFASGSFAYLGDGSTAKSLNAGSGAQAGVLAASLAAAGADGPALAFEGPLGVVESYFRLPADALAEEVADLGERWETLAIAFKPYPACHFVHAAIDAAGEAAERLGVVGQPERVTGVHVELPAPCLSLVLEPAEHKRRPRTPYEGKFSAQYSVAAMLANGSVGVLTFTPEAIADERTLAVAARVTHAGADFATFPSAFPARVAVTADDRCEVVELAHQRGAPESPLAPGAAAAKFRANAELALAPDDVERLAGGVSALAGGATVAPISALLRAARARG